jgi:hypothetical protein
MVHQKLYEWCMHPVRCNRKAPVSVVEFFWKGARYVSPSHISSLNFAGEMLSLFMIWIAMPLVVSLLFLSVM